MKKRLHKLCNRLNKIPARAAVPASWTWRFKLAAVSSISGSSD